VHNPTPGLPEFDYVIPASLAEASQFLAEHQGEARPFMGGTDTFVRMRDGFWKEKYIVDIKKLEGLKEITFDPASGLTIGAAVNMNKVAESAVIKANYPLLAEAAKTVASYQLRSRATIVGNICNASPAGDTLGACILLGGVLKVHGVDGERDEPLSSFFVGPGKSVLKSGDIATAIKFPLPPQGAVGKYIKLGRNSLSDLAIVGVTALGYPDAEVPSGYRFKVALASVAPVPLQVSQVEEVLSSQPITADVIAQAAQATMDACNPIDDVRGSARYRKFMVRNLSKRALTAVWEKLQSAP
jgi:CO/xanthine dehydrogenase FAD-binding subunit